MTQKVQNIDDLKDLNVQDIDDPIQNICNLILSIKIGGNTKLPDFDTVPDGNIILIRFIRSNRLLDIFGEKFKVSKSLVYSYVKAVIVTKIGSLQIYLGNELVEKMDYQLTA